MIIMVPVKENMLNENLPEINIITYKVKPGDTLISLARIYNSTIDDIIQRNLEQLGDGILRANSVIKIAQNSGGLTGGEDAKQKREKEQKESNQKNISKTKEDSITSAHWTYWNQPWTIIDVKKPGTINSERSEKDWRTISRLKVTGKIDLSDLSVVGKRIFEFDKIVALDLHEVYGMTKIQAKGFGECLSLQAIALPNTLDSIGAKAFTGDSKVSVIRCYAINPPLCDETSFENIDKKTCWIEVPKSALENYKKAKYWKDFNIIRSIPTIEDEKNN